MNTEKAKNIVSGITPVYSEVESIGAWQYLKDNSCQLDQWQHNTLDFLIEQKKVK